jgi:hypothetical protein
VNATITMIKRYVALLAQALASARAKEPATSAAPLEREHGVGA